MHNLSPCRRLLFQQFFKNFLPFKVGQRCPPRDWQCFGFAFHVVFCEFHTAKRRICAGDVGDANDAKPLIPGFINFVQTFMREFIRVSSPGSSSRQPAHGRINEKFSEIDLSFNAAFHRTRYNPKYLPLSRFRCLCLSLSLRPLCDDSDRQQI